MQTLPDEQRVALVTGGGRGLGRAMCLMLATLGYRVAVNYVSRPDAAQETVAAIRAAGGDGLAFRADVSKAEEAALLVAGVEAALGPVSVLVNNAGIGPVADAFSLDADGWRSVMAANLDSAFHVTQAVIPGLCDRRCGRLVFMSSVAARTGGVISAAYAASKGGVEGLMHYYATHLLHHGITSNAISPAFIESDMTAGFSVGDALPLGRKGRPEEVANALKLLVTTEYINGQTIHVNAGRFQT